MASDMKRIRTFLAYKGFQWEPLSEQDWFAAPSVDFMASREGEPSIIGTMICVGQERLHDGGPIQITTDAAQRADLRSLLRDLLEEAVRRLQGAAAADALPKVLAVVNHEPTCRFEDLAAVLEELHSGISPDIDLLIWFDDFRSDRMLFRRSETAVYQKLFDWFHVQ